MAEPNKIPSRLIRRTAPRFSNPYVAQPDAVNETLRVNGMAPEQMARRIAAVEGTRQINELRANALKQRRNAYRLRKMKEQPFAPVMTDELVDLALLQEERMANGPQLRLGYDRPKIDTQRLADLYAYVSNFYASLGSPNMMPMNTAQVQANPLVAARQLDFGLNNPALTALKIAAPTGIGSGAFSAAKTAFQGAMKSAEPVAARVMQATWQAAKAGRQAIAQNAPRVAGNALVMGVPTTAAASNFGNENPLAEGEQGGSVMPWIIGAGAVIGGRALWNKFRKGSTAAPKWLTWWERNPNTVVADARFNTLSTRYNTAFITGDLAAMNVLKTELGKSPAQTITKGTGKNAKTVNNPEFISNTDLGTMIKNRAYPQIEGFYIEPKRVRLWRNVRNWGIRFPMYSTVAGNVGQGIYNWMSGPNTQQNDSLPTREEFAPNYLETDAAVEQGNTVVATPRAAQQPDSVSRPANTGIVWSVQQ